MKICTVCKQQKPFSAFVKHSLRKDGHSTSCKSCDADGRRRRTAENLAKQAIVQAGMTEKLCRGCNRLLALASFSKRAASNDGLQERCKACYKGYNDANRDRVRERSAEYYADNKDRVLSRQAKFRIEQRAKYLAAQQKYQRLNADQIRSNRRQWEKRNIEKLRAYGVKHYQANKPQYYARGAKRRAQQGLATPAWANMEKIREFYAAAEFLSMVTGIWYEVDHIVPINSPVVCGLHCEQNLQVVTRAENRSKQNRYWPDMPFDRTMTCMIGAIAATGAKTRELLKDAA